MPLYFVIFINLLPVIITGNKLDIPEINIVVKLTMVGWSCWGKLNMFWNYREGRHCDKCPKLPTLSTVLKDDAFFPHFQAESSYFVVICYNLACLKITWFLSNAPFLENIKGPLIICILPCVLKTVARDCPCFKKPKHLDLIMCYWKMFLKW